jgi:hypothetical protein
MVSRSSASSPAAARLLMAARRVALARGVVLLRKGGLATPDITSIVATSTLSETDNCGLRPAPFPWRNPWREYQP